MLYWVGGQSSHTDWRGVHVVLSDFGAVFGRSELQGVRVYLRRESATERDLALMSLTLRKLHSSSLPDALQP